jgi:hypothetical protein
MNLYFAAKHFHLGRRAGFPVIFIVLVLLIFGAGYSLHANFNNTFWQPKSASELLVAAVGAAGGFVYFLYSQHHQGVQMFASLFDKFNTRYDKLNERLNVIISRQIGSPLTPEDINTLYDYFNLCAEEHLFYEAGYIDERIWRAWLCGMKPFAADTVIRQLWGQEINAGSYYDFRLSLIDVVKCCKAAS